MRQVIPVGLGDKDKSLRKSEKGLGNGENKYSGSLHLLCSLDQVLGGTLGDPRV